MTAFFEPLESRRLCSFTITVTHTGTLLIEGAGSDDSVHLHCSGGVMYVTETSVENGPGEYVVYAGIRRVSAYLSAGNDTFHAHGRIPLRMYIDGGSGNDRIHTGNSNDTLLGQAGDDYLFAGKGNDSLSGGSGRDRLDAADIDSFDPFFNIERPWQDRVDAQDGNADFILYDVLDKVSFDAFDSVRAGDESSFPTLRPPTEIAPSPTFRIVRLRPQSPRADRMLLALS